MIALQRMLAQSALACAVCLLCLASLPAQANTPNTLPPTRSVVHALPDATPLPQTTDPRRPPNGTDEWENPPATAFIATDGSRFATKDVNRITCRAVSAQSPGVEWLGTWMGVKVVDAVGNHNVTHYTRRDGLPGDYVEAIAVKGSGVSLQVYCLVRLGSPNHLALCTLHGDGDGSPDATRWTTLATIDAPIPEPHHQGNQAGGPIDSAWFPRSGQSHLTFTGTDDDVVIAPSTITTSSDTIAYRWEAKRGTLLPIAVSDSMHAEGEVLGINDALVTTDGTLYLATTEGLLSRPLSSDSATWQRTLPEQIVDALLVAPKSNDPANAEPTIYAACRLRMPESNEIDGVAPQPPYQLALIRPSQDNSGLSIEMAAARTVKPIMAAYDAIGITSVEEISVADDSAIWLTARARADWIGAYKRKGDGFSRYDPTTHTWTEFGLNGLKPREKAASNRIDSPALPQAIPDAAALPLAFSLLIGHSNTELAGEIGRGNDDPMRNPALWIAERFPLWRCPADEANENEKRQAIRGIVTHDPTGERHRWQTANIFLAPKIFQQNLIELSDSSILLRQKASPSNPEASYLFAGGVHEIHPHPFQMLPARPDDNTVVVLLGTGVYTLTENSSDSLPQWDRLSRSQKTDNGNSGYSWSQTTRLGRLGPSQHLYASVQGEKYLRRYDSTIHAFTETTIPLPKDLSLFGSSAAGVWLKDDINTRFIFIPLDSQDRAISLPIVVAPISANTFHLTPNPQIATISGSTLWYVVEMHPQPGNSFGTHRDGIAGYDALTRRWTAPLPLTSVAGYRFYAWVAPDGSTYVAQNQGAGAGSVFCYDPAADAWRTVAEALPAVPVIKGWPAIYQVLVADHREIYVSDGWYLFRYDRRTHAWTTSTLPAAMRDPQGYTVKPYNFILDLHTTATKRAIYLTLGPGLWRFDRMRQEWQEIRQPVSLDPPDRPYQIAQNAPHAKTHPISGSRSLFATALTTPETYPASWALVLSLPTKSDAYPHIPQGVYLSLHTADDHNIWGFASAPFQAASFPVRFDLQTRRFRVYEESDGIPIGSDTIYDVGDSVWIKSVNQGTLFHLNPQTDRFEEAFARPADQDKQYAKTIPAGVLPGELISLSQDPYHPDFDYLTIRLETTDADGNSTSFPLLYRFHKRTNQLERIPLDTAFRADLAKITSGHRVYGMGLLVTPAHLWISTSIGLLMVDIATGRWSFAKLPEGAPAFPVGGDIHADSSGGVWITAWDHGSTLRLVP